MNLIELDRALRQLRMSGIAATLETRLLQAQTDAMTHIDLVSTLVSDELECRSKRLLERRHKQAEFRDPDRCLDNFDFQFNPKMNRNLIFDLATAAWVQRREDSLFQGPPGTGKSHLAQAIGHAVIQQGYRVLYREAHILVEELADATLDGQRKEHMELLSTVPLLIIDDLGMRKLPLTAAEELLEIIMRRYAQEGWLFLAVVIDLFSRKVVGWSMRPDMHRSLVIDALEMGLFQRRPPKGLMIFHSDGGSQYGSEDFRRVLDQHGVQASMSRKGNCWDNAVTETLFGSLKVERLHGERFQTIRQAQDAALAWLLWYNRRRMHSTLNYLRPAEFESRWENPATLAAA